MIGQPNVSDVVIDVLVKAGARHLFGIPGDAINHLIEAVRGQDTMRFIQVRHEEAGALAASA
jgi:thiamine pyrophosphate-dependent acetolactate synthase large subunit-like protein